LPAVCRVRCGRRSPGRCGGSIVVTTHRRVRYVA
jgi:hypothetical protein